MALELGTMRPYTERGDQRWHFTEELMILSLMYYVIGMSELVDDLEVQNTVSWTLIAEVILYLLACGYLLLNQPLRNLCAKCKSKFAKDRAVIR